MRRSSASSLRPNRMTRWPRAVPSAGELAPCRHVGVEHRRAVPRQQLGEEAALGREIGRHVGVIIEMVARQVGERRRRQREPVEAELVEPVARGLERDMVDALPLRGRCSSRCSATGSGVVRLPAASKSGPTMPRVPRLAARQPSRAQICRVKAATEVLPLVPVTAAIDLGLRRVEARRHVGEAPARVGIDDDGGRRASSATRAASAVSTAAAPRATASAMKRAPSVRLPASAAKRKPGFASRESAVSPVISGSSGGGVEIEGARRRP